MSGLSSLSYDSNLNGDNGQEVPPSGNNTGTWDQLYLTKTMTDASSSDDMFCA